jgi:hypothetical protein
MFTIINNNTEALNAIHDEAMTYREAALWKLDEVTAEITSYSTNGQGSNVYDNLVAAHMRAKAYGRISDRIAEMRMEDRSDKDVSGVVAEIVFTELFNWNASSSSENIDMMASRAYFSAMQSIAKKYVRYFD